MVVTAYNMKLKRKETMKKPTLHKVQRSDGRVIYLLKGTGSDGTRMARIISHDAAMKYKKGKASPMAVAAKKRKTPKRAGTLAARRYRAHANRREAAKLRDKKVRMPTPERRAIRIPYKLVTEKELIKAEKRRMRKARK
jgi:hypothetical protein